MWSATRLCTSTAAVLLYVNDIHTCLNFILFADDTNLFISGKNIEELETLLNWGEWNVYKQGPITRSEHPHFYFWAIFQAKTESPTRLIYERIQSVGYQKGKRNVIKMQKLLFLGL